KMSHFSGSIWLLTNSIILLFIFSGPVSLAPTDSIRTQLHSSVRTISPGTNLTLSCQLENFEPQDTDYFKVHFPRRTQGLLATYDYYRELNLKEPPPLNLTQHNSISFLSLLLGRFPPLRVHDLSPEYH